MIPKIIHYCWFGGNAKNELITKCLLSWRLHMPDYQIIEWNESNFDVNKNEFVKEAFIRKKWAFVSDYVRAYALYHMGGIYLDTDVEIRIKLDEFLHHGAFSGFETQGFCFTAVWGAQKGHHWPKRVLDDYIGKEFSLETNTESITNLLVNEYGFDNTTDSLQNYKQDIFIYPSNYFCVDLINYATHHFEGSWVDPEHKINYKEFITSRFYANRFLLSGSTFEDALLTLQNAYGVTSFRLFTIGLKKIIKRMFKSLNRNRN